METNKRQHFISLFILSLLLSCSGEKKDSAQTETVSNKAIVRIETVSAQDVEQISEFTATVEANISNNIAPQNPVRIEKLFAEGGDHVKQVNSWSRWMRQTSNRQKYNWITRNWSSNVLMNCTK